jgi:hypothetical protein
MGEDRDPALPPRTRLPTATVLEWTAIPSSPVAASLPMMEKVPSSSRSSMKVDGAWGLWAATGTAIMRATRPMKQVL